MKLDEIVNESAIKNWAKKLQYKMTGTGEKEAVNILFREKFIKKFKEKFKSEKSNYDNQLDAAKSTVAQFLRDYRWQPDREELQQLSTLLNAFGPNPSNEKVVSLAEFLLTMGEKKEETKKQQRIEPTLNNQPANNSAPALSTKTNQLVTSIQQMSGAANLDDLETIAKVAMAMLYKQNPAAYTKLYKEITTGVDQDDNSNIVRGYNESKKYKK